MYPWPESDRETLNKKNRGQAPKDVNGTDPIQNVSRSDPKYRHEPSRGVRAGPYRPALDGSPGREVGDRCQHHRVHPSTTDKGSVANQIFCCTCHPFQGDIGCGWSVSQEGFRMWPSIPMRAVILLPAYYHRWCVIAINTRLISIGNTYERDRDGD